jgi:hypothetical protein
MSEKITIKDLNEWIRFYSKLNASDSLKNAKVAREYLRDGVAIPPVLKKKVLEQRNWAYIRKGK